MANLVSIIIPCYNVENYILRALNSVFNQSFSDLEVICINDGSKDNTLQVINEYIKEKSINIKIITTDNCGVSSARNIGIEMAQGKYIMFLDADDLYGNRVIESLVDAMENKNVDTAYTYWCSKKEEIVEDGFDTENVNQYNIMRHFMYRKTPISFVNFIYKRSILEKYHIRFDNDIRYGEDNLFFWKYLCHIKNGIYVNAPMYWYFQNEESAMHNPSWKITEAVNAIEKAEVYMQENNFPYINEFKEYMLARTKFSIAKEFAKYEQNENFYKFCKQYNLRKEAKKLINKNGLMLTCSAFLMEISPKVFYTAIGVVSKRKG